MKDKISEGAVSFHASLGKVSKDLDVFYNPVMKYNRDISIAVIDAYFDKEITVGLPLAGSGIRGLRLAKECKTPIKKIYLNDMDKDAVKAIKKNTKGIKRKVTRKRAQQFFLDHGPFDYIDIDPFGSSIPFVESAVSKLYSNGILALTNTDTAALCGSYPTVTKRRYGSVPFNHAIRQEFGLRILIKRVQEIAAMQDVALIPIFSYSKDHYMRVFLKKVNGKKPADRELEKHKFFEADSNRILKESKKAELGPIYTGDLWDKKIVRKMKTEDKATEEIKREAEVNQLFFYDPHELAKFHRINVPSYEKIYEYIEKKGYTWARTHFCKTGIKTDMPKNTFLKLFKK